MTSDELINSLYAKVGELESRCPSTCVIRDEMKKVVLTRTELSLLEAHKRGEVRWPPPAGEQPEVRQESGPSMTADTLAYLTTLSDKVKAAESIWTAIGHLTEALGAKAGGHLETLLCKEIAANQPPPERLPSPKGPIHPSNY